MVQAHDTKIGGLGLKVPTVRSLSGLFAGQVEESIRLRLLALATYWLVALSLAWVGGSPWTWLGGGIAATVGHAFSWHRRNRSLGSWSILMVVMVIGLAIIMRSDMLAALDGNWLPLAHFLLLIQAVASFDARTRGGLYAALFLSGIVLFFASQQAFELSFGIFLIGYAALLMTFLATAYVEDETRKAQTSSPETRLSLFGFWSGIGVTVLALAVLAFLLLPRGESNAVGYQQVSALPITGEPTGQDASPTTSSQPSISSESPVPAPSESSPSVQQTPIDAQPNDAGQPGETGQPSVQGAGETTGIAEAEPTRRALLGSNVFSSFGLPAEGDSVVMHVRSPVASYWRGEVFDTFDGTYWKGGKISSGQGAVTRLPGSREYTQTFFIEDDRNSALFMGYSGQRVLSSDDQVLDRTSLGDGASYKVVSSLPGLDPDVLRQDSPATLSPRFHTLPSSSAGPLYEMAEDITAGATTGFDKAVRIVDYLQRTRRFDDSAGNQLESSQGGYEGLLFEDQPGTSMDFATASVMLARAAGLPARVAVGYLPGERDPLSGAYKVRGRDAHAWAEVYFEESGWVPFDGSPRPDVLAPGSVRGGQLAGVRYLFENSFGDDLLRAMVIAPSRLSSGIKTAFSGAIGIAIAVVIGAAAVAMVWFGARLLRKARKPNSSGWSYDRLAGASRDEMLTVFRKVERLLQKKGIPKRERGQTLQEYARSANEHTPRVLEHLNWFVKASTSAAYDPSVFSSGTVEEARVRFAFLKAALLSGRLATSH